LNEGGSGKAGQDPENYNHYRAGGWRGRAVGYGRNSSITRLIAAHFCSNGLKIWKQTDGKVSAFCSRGHGGTLAGT